jgi:iron complex outermembrane receptor protein
MAGRSVFFGRAAFLCSALVFSSCLLFSQRLEGQTNSPAPEQILSGVVTDPSRAAVSSAVVDLSCGAVAKNTVTSPDGEFSIKLPPGKCSIRVRSGSFALYKQEILINEQTAHTPISIRLALDTEKSSVTVTANEGFVAHDTQTATKTKTPLIETPQSISVITLDELTQRNVQSVTEALSYTPGVHAEAYGSDSRYDWITIRGFNAGTFGMFRDGLRWQSGQISGRTEPYGLEELDVLKGPASVLYGQGEPGGIINMVSKRPLSTPLHQLELDGGSYTRRQVKMDMSGPLDTHARLLYRVTSLIRNSDTQVDFVPDYRRYVAPAFTWLPDSKTSLTLLGEYQHDKTDWGQCLPAYGTLLPNPNGRVPVNRYTGEPGYNYFRRKQYHVGWQFERHLSKIWTVRQNSRYSVIN